MSEKKSSWLKRTLSARGAQSVVTAACGFVLLFIIFSLLSPQFRSGNNIQNLFRQIAPTLIIGIGQGFVLITGNIDLSIGSVVGMACMTAGTLMSHGMNPWLACLAALGLSVPCHRTCKRRACGEGGTALLYRDPWNDDVGPGTCAACQ